MEAGFRICRFTTGRCPNNYFYCPNSKISKKFLNLYCFVVSKIAKIRYFGTKIVPTTSELNLTFSIYYSNAIAMKHTNLALFSVSKNIDISKTISEKRYGSINIGYISNNISNTIPLRVCLISEIRCLTRIFAVR